MNYLDKFSLQSKISLITGGAGGIGEEICKALLDAGPKAAAVERKAYSDSDNSLLDSFISFTVLLRLLLNALSCCALTFTSKLTS